MHRVMTSSMATPQVPVAFHQPAAPATSPSHFSVVVDDVDAGGRGGTAQMAEDDSQTLHKLLTGVCSQCSGDKEESDAKIRQIQVEAESRKLEFARLLEEHAQVIRKLKQMEEDGAALGTTTTA